MCGIAGFIEISRGQGNEALKRTVTKMSDSLMHRGPDDKGCWVDENIGIAMAHRRLSIIDISTEGRQPMVSHTGRFVTVFNGEIYNFKEIRADLAKEGYAFRGHSDTEVMLASFEKWGVEDAVRYFIGMFAFAVLDRKELLLYLVRDRIGKKPLYYGRAGKAILFASELKALAQYPDFNREVDRNSLALFLRFNNVPAPYSIYKDIFKLEPATILAINLQGAHNGYVFKKYWSPKDIAENGIRNHFGGTAAEAVSCVDSLMRDSVRMRMISDVPIGSFLSGGIDSSLVTALMQSQSSVPIKTFTIGFFEKDYNEAADAKAVSGHLGTQHTELYVTPQEAMAAIPRLPVLYDEPFADSSQIPTYLVSRLARGYVTVGISGDGGDELFAGYNRYFWVKKIWSKMNLLPRKTRLAISGLLKDMPVKQLDDFLGFLEGLLPRKFRHSMHGGKLQKLSDILSLESLEQVYLRLVSHWQNPGTVVLNAVEPVSTVTDRKNHLPIGDFTQKMMFLDLISYLSDDLLTKVDRASMGIGLEVRAPILDHRVVELAWKLPLNMKIRNNQSKWILRQVLYKYIPRKIIERPKMGFSVPVDNWLRGPLREWAESLINSERLKNEGFFNAELINQAWKEHVSAKYDLKDRLWPVLMFQAWKEEWLDK